MLSQATQSALELHWTVGTPFVTGHVAVLATQLPAVEHTSPLAAHWAFDVQTTQR
jgi:hypothetical protein